MHFIPNEIVTNMDKYGRDHGAWAAALIRRPRWFRVKLSLTRDLIRTALVQKLRLNQGQGQIWTWFKLDRRWWNAPL